MNGNNETEGQELVQLNVTVSKDIKQWVSDEAWRQRLPMSTFISQLIQDYQGRKEVK